MSGSTEDTASGPAVVGWVWAVTASDIGPLLLAATGEGLVNVVFHAEEGVRRRALAKLEERLQEPGAPLTERTGEGPGGDREDPAAVLLRRAQDQLQSYFDGSLREFTLPLDWRMLPPGDGFRRAALDALTREVPYGKVTGYGELARRVGSPGASQAVGLAMGANPLPVVVPCHRVVEKDGGLGGFGGGRETKRQLLTLEGVLPQPLF